MNDNLTSLEEGWNTIRQVIVRLENVLEELSEPGISVEEFTMLYSTVYNMCFRTSRNYAELYKRYRKTLEEYITSMILPRLMEQGEEYLLKELAKRWQRYKCLVRWLSHCFCYLDRFYASAQNLPSLHHLGITLFHHLVYSEAMMRVKVVNAVTSHIHQEREGEKLDGALLRNLADVMFEIGKVDRDCYKEFEVVILQSATIYYSPKASNWFLHDSFSDYVLKAEECLKREKERIAPYMPSSIQPLLLQKVKEEFYTQELLDRELNYCHSNFRDDEKIDYLSKTYILFSKLPHGLNHVYKIFEQHVTAKGMELVKQTEYEGSCIKGFIQDLIELHNKYLDYVRDKFDNHMIFIKAHKSAHVVLCNEGHIGSEISEQLAYYCDNLLKKGARKTGDENIEETLEKVVELISCIDNKDLFAEFYRKKLAYRLLFKKNEDYDLVRSFLTKLKHRFGYMFILKMEGMVKDLMLAKENQNKFVEYLNNNTDIDAGMELDVTVLTSGSWPNYKSFNLTPPREMVRCVEVFEKFYHTNTQRRKLKWIYSLGSCDVLGNFEAKTMELNVTPGQASLLLLFNSSDRLSYSEIKMKLNLSDDDVIRLLRSVSCGKYKILNRASNSETVSSTDYFEFNSKFTNRVNRIKIPLPRLNEKKKIVKDVDTDRRCVIDASLVRIMKSRRVLGHNQLIIECLEHLRPLFKPDVRAIKLRIEDLILREYMERDRQDVNLYKYLA
ncbi:cullin-1 [Senna tora]|uniref:Cullin-1 n=1 Tax=Senna tora TaxID=362788 RepID=A0A834X4U0_9FABA|nr:cullin-1 [Senna tora]